MLKQVQHDGPYEMLSYSRMTVHHRRMTIGLGTLPQFGNDQAALRVRARRLAAFAAFRGPRA